MPDYWLPEITPSDEFLMALNAPTYPKDWTPWIKLAAENWNIDKRRGKFGDDSTGLRVSVREKKDPGVVWVGSPGTYVNGYTAETGRDLGHVDVAFVSVINSAEIAWHQGDRSVFSCGQETDGVHGIGDGSADSARRPRTV